MEDFDEIFANLNEIHRITGIPVTFGEFGTLCETEVKDLKRIIERVSSKMRVIENYYISHMKERYIRNNNI